MRPALAVLVCVAALSVIVTVVAAQTVFGTVAVSATATIVVPPLAEDVDGDGCVGNWDLYLVSRDLEQVAPETQATNVNADGAVDVGDVAAVAALFGTRTFGTAPCP